MKTSELTGIALDWAVAKCLPEPKTVLGLLDLDIYNGFNPSTNWAQGGPIIERHRIEICHLDNGEWRAQLKNQGWGFHCRHYGETPLIAAMRCYVASKLGDTIDIPEELK